MPLALTATMRFSPERILKSRWTHDTAHDMIRAKMRAELKHGLLGRLGSQTAGDSVTGHLDFWETGPLGSWASMKTRLGKNS